ncbi:CP089-like protein, partial [Mya arenaria]
MSGNIESAALNPKQVRDIKEANNLLRKTLSALKGALNFFSRQYQNVNLDAVIGTRIVDGYLKVLLNHIDYEQESWPLDEDILQAIRDVQSMAMDVSDKAIPFVEITDPPYYRMLGTLIQRDFWAIDFASKDLSPKDFYSAWLPRPGESMAEEESDNCITELLGTGEEMNQQRTLHSQPPPAELVNQFCASTYLESKSIEEQGFPQLKQDLFMEQAALCGLAGYRWFFSPDWLQTILSWQDKETGCFKGATILENQVRMRKPAGGAQLPVSRVKREERILPDGCLCHRTTVAAGALAAYVRYIAEYMQMRTIEDNLIDNNDDKRHGVLKHSKNVLNV